MDILSTYEKVNDIINHASKFLDIPLAYVKGAVKGHQKPVHHFKKLMITAYIKEMFPKLTLQEMASLMGGKNHATVFNRLKVHNQELDTNKLYIKDYNNFKKAFTEYYVLASCKTSEIVIEYNILNLDKEELKNKINLLRSHAETLQFILNTK